MKKGLKKAFVFIVAASAALQLSACSPGNQPAGESQASQATEGKNNAAGDPVEITYYTYSTNTDESAVGRVAEEINKISQAEIGIKLKLVTMDSGSYGEKMRLVIASNQAYDVCFSSSWLNDFNGNASKGAFFPLNELLKVKAPELYASVDEKLWNSIKINGNIYGMFGTNGYQGHVKGYAINTELAKKYNFDYSAAKKPADYEVFLEAVKANEPELTPFFPDINVLPMPFNLETGYTIDYVRPVFGFNKDTMKFYNYLESEELQNLLGLYHKWYNKGYIPKDVVSRKDMFAEQQTGRYALFSVGNITPGSEITKINGTEYLSVPWTPPYISTPGLTQGLIAINKNSKNPEAAMEFCEFAFKNQKITNLMNYGLQDVNYRLENDKVVLNENTGYGFVYTTPRDIMKTYLKDSQSINDFKKSMEMNKTGSMLPISGFSLEQTPIKSQMTEISSIMSKYVSLLCTGTSDPAATIPEITKQLNNAGLKDVLAEVQKQFETWYASNK